MRTVYSEMPRDVEFKRLNLHTGRRLEGWIVEENQMLGKPTVRFHVSLDSSGKYCGSAHWIAKDEISTIEDLKYNPAKDNAVKVLWKK